MRHTEARTDTKQCNDFYRKEVNPALWKPHATISKGMSAHLTGNKYPAEVKDTWAQDRQIHGEGVGVTMQTGITEQPWVTGWTVRELML